MCFRCILVCKFFNKLLVPIDLEILIKMLCCMPSIIPQDASVQMLKLMRILRVLAVIQVGLGIACLLVNLFSMVLMIFGGVVLLLISCTRNWCGCMCFIVLCIYDTVLTISTTGSTLTRYNLHEAVLVYVSLLKLPYYLVAAFYCFLAYRELKGLSIEYTGAERFGSLDFSQHFQEQPLAQSQPSQPRYQPFSGIGHNLD